MAIKLSELGKKIERLMFVKDIKTQRELAQKAKLIPVHLHKIMTGKIKNPDEETLKRIADALGANVQELDPKSQNHSKTSDPLDKVILLAGENAILKDEIEKLKSNPIWAEVEKLKRLWGEDGYQVILNCRKLDVVSALEIIVSPLDKLKASDQNHDSRGSRETYKSKTRKSHNR